MPARLGVKPTRGTSLMNSQGQMMVSTRCSRAPLTHGAGRKALQRIAGALPCTYLSLAAVVVCCLCAFPQPAHSVRRHACPALLSNVPRQRSRSSFALTAATGLLPLLHSVVPVTAGPCVCLPWRLSAVTACGRTLCETAAGDFVSLLTTVTCTS